VLQIPVLASPLSISPTSLNASTGPTPPEGAPVAERASGWPSPTTSPLSKEGISWSVTRKTAVRALHSVCQSLLVPILVGSRRTHPRRLGVRGRTQRAGFALILDIVISNGASRKGGKGEDTREGPRSHVARRVHLRPFHLCRSNQSMPPIITTSTMYSIIGAYCFTLAHWTPSTHPRTMNAPFQKVLPRMV
jgi:hypothetical protein